MPKKEAENSATEELRVQIAHIVNDRITVQKHLQLLEGKDMQFFGEKKSKLQLLAQYVPNLFDCRVQSLV